MRAAIIAAIVLVVLLIYVLVWALCKVNADLDDWDEKHRGIRRS